jgi:hypothetical protein
VEPAIGEGGSEIQPDAWEALKKWAWVRFIALALCFVVATELTKFSFWRGVSGLVLIAGLCSVLFPLWPRRLFGRFIGNLEYIRVSDLDLERRVRARYQAEINELKSLGFDFLFFQAETFLLARLLLIYPVVVLLLMVWKREVLVLRHGKILLAHPIFVSGNRTAYAYPIGLGVKFHTAFQDGTRLVSAGKLSPYPGSLGVHTRGPALFKRGRSMSEVSRRWRLTAVGSA